MTPLSLNELAEEWSQFILSKPSTQTVDMQAHVLGLHSVYLFVLSILHTDHVIKFYYVGETFRKPGVRLSEHISEFVRCSIKTKHGKSVLYDPKFMHGAIGFKYELSTLVGGITERKTAQQLEAKIAADYEMQYPGFVLSKQCRGRGKDTRPRQRKTKNVKTDLLLGCTQ